MQLAVFKRLEHEGYFLNALQSRLAFSKHAAHGFELFLVASREGDDGLQFFHGLFAEADGTQFVVDFVEANLVELVDGHRDVDNLVGFTDDFGNARKDFSVIDFDADANAETSEHLIDNLHQFNFIQERVGADDIGVTLIELAVASLLRTVGTPNRLNLETLERHLEFIAVLHHIACERHGEVVAQALFAEACGEAGGRVAAIVFSADAAAEIARVKNLEEQFVAFFSIFTHQRGEVLHGWCLDLAEAVEGIYFADGVEYIVALGHFNGAEVACSLWNTWFLCHFYMID